MQGMLRSTVRGFCSLLAWFVILFMNRGLKQVGENWFCHLKALDI